MDHTSPTRPPLVRHPARDLSVNPRSHQMSPKPPSSGSNSPSGSKHFVLRADSPSFKPGQTSPVASRDRTPPTHRPLVHPTPVMAAPFPELSPRHPSFTYFFRVPSPGAVVLDTTHGARGMLPPVADASYSARTPHVRTRTADTPPRPTRHGVPLVPPPPASWPPHILCSPPKPSSRAPLTRELLQQHANSAPTRRDHVLRKDLLERLEVPIKAAWPEAHIHVFGSSATGFVTRASDLDIDLCSDSAGGKHRSIPPKDLLPRVASALSCSGFEVRCVNEARVPVVKLTDAATGLHCDITHLDHRADKITQLMSDYSRADPRVVPFVLAIKTWSKARGLADAARGTLSSIGWTLLALQCLQLTYPQVIPSFQNKAQRKQWRDLRGASSCHTSPQVLKPHRAARKRSKTVPDNIQLSDLMQHFFHLFADNGLINTGTQCVSVRAGALVPAHNAKCVKSVHTQPVLLVEDPFDEDHNIAKGLQQEGLTLIKAECTRARRMLRECQTFAAVCSTADPPAANVMLRGPEDEVWVPQRDYNTDKSHDSTGALCSEAGCTHGHAAHDTCCILVDDNATVASEEVILGETLSHC